MGLKRLQRCRECSEPCHLTEVRRAEAWAEGWTCAAGVAGVARLSQLRERQRGDLPWPVVGFFCTLLLGVAGIIYALVRDIILPAIRARGGG
jgi:hypothetical protein